MLVNKVSAFNAVVPKDVLNSDTAQNFKTKPMGLDSVSFGMAKVPAGNPDVFYEKLNDSAESFAKAIQDAAPNREEVFKFLNTYYNNIRNYNGKEYRPLSQLAAQKEDPAYLKAIIDTLFDKKDPKDNRTLAKVMAGIDYSKIKSDSVKQLCSETIKHLISTSTSGKPEDIPYELIVKALKFSLVDEDDFRKPGAETASSKLLYALALLPENHALLLRTIKSYPKNSAELASLLSDKFKEPGIPESNAISEVLSDGKVETLNTITSLFDKNNPEDNRQLANVMKAIHVRMHEDDKISKKAWYINTVSRLAIDCADIDKKTSIDLIDRALALGIPKEAYEQSAFINAKKWLLGHSESE